MTDMPYLHQAIQEATASEPLTLVEEYENQSSWRESHDKLTFILCQPLAGSDGPETSAGAGQVDDPDKMIGDINFFLYPWDEDDEEDALGGAGANGRAQQRYCTGEVDIMIAGPQDRGRGLGKAAVSTFLYYIWSNLDAILGEYQSQYQSQSQSQSSSQSSSPGRAEGAPRLRLKSLMAKIKATNAHSIALFKGLGFEQEGCVNYFGEVKLVLRDLDRIAAPPGALRVLDYSRPVN